MSSASKPFVISLVLGFLFLFCVQSTSAANTIAGRVYDKQRALVIDIDIELLDEYYRLLRRTKTDGAGYYQFDGLNNGNYTVRVGAYRFDFLEQSQYVEIAAVSAIPGQMGSSYNQVDFYLVPKRGGIRDAELSVIFAQEVPKSAEAAYKKATEHLSRKRTDEGIAALKEAVKLFPKYYSALQRLGQELFLKKLYGESAHYLLKAVEINPRSATSFYYIGYSFYHLGKDYYKAAITSLNKAVELAPASYQIFLLLGRVERSYGKFADAEKHLLQAKKFAGNKVPEVHMELAQLYGNDLKKFNEAANELELYLKASDATAAEKQEVKSKIGDLRQKAKTQFAS